jgi:pimeloyl-ACP methyl ester carboxylesterase
MLPPLDCLDLSHEIKVYHRGPALKQGPLPSIFYFSLSGEESLNLDPYNQPAMLLAEQGLRVFSLTLPGHEGVFPHKAAIKEWSDAISSGNNIIATFVETCLQALNILIDKQYVDPNYVGVAGLSRGAFIATHLAVQDPRITTVLGFAPLTTFSTMKDFESMSEMSLAQSLSIKNLIPFLIKKSVRYYIGNHDTMVNTQECFSFIHDLAEAGYQETHRFIPAELIIYPSIGHKGHGTPPEIFQDGSMWLVHQLKN